MFFPRFISSETRETFGNNNVIRDMATAVRNLGVDLIETSDYAKFNFMNFAAGGVNHPSSYEWTTN